MIIQWRDTEESLNLVFCDDDREQEIGNEARNDVEDPSGYEKSWVSLA